MFWSKIRPLLPVFIAAAISLSIVVGFHIWNRGVFPWDPMDYFRTTQWAYLTYQAHGGWAAFQELYAGWAWKPILHQALALPVLILFHGRVLATVAVMSVIFYFIFIFATASLLLEFLPPLESAIGLIFIGASPSVLTYAFFFFSEIYFVAALFSFVLCLRKSRFLTGRGMSALGGFWLGLSACFRPVETVLVVTVPLFAYLYALKRRSLVSGGDLLWILVSLGSSASVFAFVFHSGRPSLFPFLPAVAAVHALAAFWYFRPARSRGKAHIFGFLSISQWIALLWYAPSVGRLHAWFTDCTWGALTAAAVPMSRVLFFKNVLFGLGGYPIAFMLALGLVGWLCARPRPRLRPGLLSVIAISVLFPVLVGATTANTDNRYYLGIFLLMDVLALGVALAPSWPLRSLRLVLIASLSTVALVSAIAEIVGFQRPALEIYHEFSGGPWYALGIWTRPEPLGLMLQNLGKDPEFQRPFSFLILPLETGDDTDLAMDAPLLRVLSAERGFSWHFNSVDPSSLDGEIRQIGAANADSIWIEIPPGTHPKAGISVSTAALFLLENYERGKIENLKVLSWEARNGHPGRILMISREAALRMLKEKPGIPAGNARKTL